MFLLRPDFFVFLLLLKIQSLCLRLSPLQMFNEVLLDFLWAKWVQARKQKYAYQTIFTPALTRAMPFWASAEESVYTST